MTEPASSPQSGPVQVLREYGQAMRGSWAGIDGRSVRDQLDTLAGVIESGVVVPLPTLRQMVDICPHGGGHWSEYCDDSCGGGS